jgi:hypothetical protein
MINHCSESDCPCNDKKGGCRIKTCILIDPFTAVEEMNEIKREMELKA